MPRAEPEGLAEASQNTIFSELGTQNWPGEVLRGGSVLLNRYCDRPEQLVGARGSQTYSQGFATSVMRMSSRDGCSDPDFSSEVSGRLFARFNSRHTHINHATIISSRKLEKSVDALDADPEHRSCAVVDSIADWGCEFGPSLWKPLPHAGGPCAQ